MRRFSLKRFSATTKTRSIEFLRDRAAMAWNLMVPVLMVLGFAAIFSGPEKPLFTVAVLSENEPSADLHPFLASRHIQFIRAQNRTIAVEKVARHRVDLLLDLQSTPARYWANPESRKSEVVESLLQASRGPEIQKQSVSAQAVRYVDWVMPGILGMNMMFSCLWGVGFVIVRYRKSGHLKRLQATPLTALEFVSAQVASRLVVVMIATAIMYAACDLFIDFPMAGTYTNLLIVTLLGSLALTSMGLLVAARVASEEISGGLLNLLSVPMMILSGVFFSLDGAPRAIQIMAEFMPLTHLLNAARSIMFDGAKLADLAYPLSILATITVACLFLSARMFKWTRD